MVEKNASNPKPYTWNPIKGYLSVVAAAVFWASSGTAGKSLFQDGMSPTDLVQVRVTCAWLFLAFAMVLRGRNFLKIQRADILFIALPGGMVLSLVQITYFYTISLIQVAAAIFIQYLSPVIVTLFSVCYMKERMTAPKGLSLLLAILGCYLVVGGYDLQLLEMNRMGILYGLFSSLCFASYTLFGEKAMRRYPPWTVLFYTFLFAALAWNIFYSPFKYLVAGYSLKEWGWMLYISLMGTLIPFALFFLGINYIRSTRASITATLEPIAAGFIAYLFLGETLELLQMLGGALVVAAVVLLQLKKEKDDLIPADIRAREKA
jgi:drug/metabolite transporter (DMT)-like permease